MIFVTGGTGIVGSRILFDLLKAGADVRAMKRKASDMDFVQKVFTYYDPSEGKALLDKINWVDCDVLDVVSLEEAMEGVSQVYHCAALVSYAAKDAEELLAVNADGTANVVNCALDAGVYKLCHISSTSAIGKEKDGRAASEDTAWKKSTSNSIYGLSKHLAEREVWRGTAEGLPAVIVNPSVILGPAKKDQSSGRLMHLLSEGVAYFPPGSSGFVDVRDVSSAAISLMNSSISGERFLLNAEQIPFKHLLEMAANVFGSKPPTFALKPWMLTLAWRAAAIGAVFSRKSPRVTKETARSASQLSNYDNRKVKAALGMDFILVEQSLAYFRNFYA